MTARGFRPCRTCGGKRRGAVAPRSAKGCPACKGTGTPTRLCGACQGAGTRRDGTPCPACAGRGRASGRGTRPHPPLGQPDTAAPLDASPGSPEAADALGASGEAEGVNMEYRHVGLAVELRDSDAGSTCAFLVAPEYRVKHASDELRKALDGHRLALRAGASSVELHRTASRVWAAALLVRAAGGAA